MSILFAVLLFSILIFVHELGHFAAAKLSGVQVNEFSMFMGPAIFKKQVGNTLYAIRCIPIGGYCAMEGEDADTDSPHSFQKAAWWKRLIILLAGSAMNFLAGLIIFAIVFAPVKQFIEPVISTVDPNSSVYGTMLEGDRILEVDGEKIYVQSNFSMLLSLMPGDTHDILVQRDGSKVLLEDLLLEKRQFEDGAAPRYGFSFTVADATFGSKLKYVGNTALDTVRTVRLSLKMLLTGQAGLKDMTGPVGIVQIMSQTAQESDSTSAAIYNMLYFGGFIAINLAVMNLLPIPALDGGRAVGLLLTAFVQKLTKKRIDPKVEGYIHAAGMILLLIFMALIMFKDIFTIFKG